MNLPDSVNTIAFPHSLSAVGGTSGTPFKMLMNSIRFLSSHSSLCIAVCPQAFYYSSSQLHRLYHDGTIGYWEAMLN